MKRLLTYTPIIAITLLIPLLSLVNPQKFPDAAIIRFTGADKIIHAAMYALLTLAWAHAFSIKMRTNLCLMLGTAFLVALYGLLMELCQYVFTSTRSMEMFDATANLVGALCTAIIIYRLSLRRVAKNCTNRTK